jgi:hypothetical protein
LRPPRSTSPRRTFVIFDEVHVVVVTPLAERQELVTSTHAPGVAGVMAAGDGVPVVEVEVVRVTS